MSRRSRPTGETPSANRGSIVREGAFKLASDSGKSGIDFFFDGDAASAYLELRGDVALTDGAITSTADLPATRRCAVACGPTKRAGS